MGSKRLTPANYLTVLRLLFLPVLWVIALLGSTLYLGIGLAVAGLTDVLDGAVARITGHSSSFGSQLDSIADILLMASIFAWILLLRPRFFADNIVPLAAWAVIGAAALVATLVKFRQLGDLHLYSAKIAGVLGYVFVVALFVLDEYSRLFFGIAVAAAIVGAAETLLVTFTHDSVDDRIGSIFRRPRGSSQPPA